MYLEVIWLQRCINTFVKFVGCNNLMQRLNTKVKVTLAKENNNIENKDK